MAITSQNDNRNCQTCTVGCLQNSQRSAPRYRGKYPPIMTYFINYQIYGKRAGVGVVVVGWGGGWAVFVRVCVGKLNIIQKWNRYQNKNYRTLTLLPTIYKIWASVVSSRICTSLNVLIGEHQCAYKTHTSAIYIFYDADLKYISEGNKRRRTSISRKIIWRNPQK